MVYYAKVNWWKRSASEDQISHMFIMADDWNEAMQGVTESFDDINSIDMEVVESDQFGGIIYVPEDVVERIKEENMW